MNVSREVVTDLLPLYFSGEASEDTRQLVEEFFRENPDYERVARAAAKPLEDLRNASRAAPEAEKEKREMECLGWELRSRRVFLFGALFFTLWPLVSLVSENLGVWLGAPHTWGGRVVGWCGAAFFWLLYILRRDRKNVLLAQAIMVSAGETALILDRLGVIRTQTSRASTLAVIGIGALATLCWIWYVRTRIAVRRRFDTP